MSLDLAGLSPSDLAALKQALLGVDALGRSPNKPRQLHDLRLLPTATDPRPTFFWSAESPRDAGDLNKTTLYPRLMWHGESGKEITVDDAAAQSTYTASGYLLTAPGNAEAPDPMDALRDALEAMSPEDRKALIQAQSQDRIGRIQEQLAALPEDKLAALLAAVQDDPQTVKRGPGRPRKEQVA